MHLKRIHASNVRNLTDGWHDFSAGDHAVRQWVLLPADESGSVLARCAALACAGGAHVKEVHGMSPLPADEPKRPAELLAEQSLHFPQERASSGASLRRLGWTWTGQTIRSLIRREHPDGLTVTTRARPLSHGMAFMFVGYGKHLEAHDGEENFHLESGHRLPRFASLLRAPGRITNSAAFLALLRHKAKYRKAGRKHVVLIRLQQELGAWLGVSLAAWHPEAGDPPLREVPARLRLAVALVLDLVRHVLDATRRIPDVFQQTGVVVFDGVSRWCPADEAPNLFRLLNRVFPRLQYLVRLSQAEQARFPQNLLEQTLPVEHPAPAPQLAAPEILRVKGVLLADVDGVFPNLALMKISAHFKRRRQPVLLRRGAAFGERADAVYASCVFSSLQSAARLSALRVRHGRALRVGGSGVDLSLRLPREIEAEVPDFSLYPELGDRAIGFLTRGCPKRCSFCIVPRKEGPPSQVSDLEELLQGRRKLILLDDNLLAHPQAVGLLEEMVRRNVAVNFNQTLDLRMVTPEIAALLRRIPCQNVTFKRPNYYFSLNDTRGLEILRRHYELMRFTSKDNVEFICMYGYNTTLAEDLERFAFLRSLPRAYVFVQQYLHHPSLRRPKPRPFFDEAADARLDALIRIVFTQNMKSMEKYYRWVCLEYARQCGRIHRPLVETLYRYNRRQSMGGFVAKLQALCLRHETAAPR
jgi:hypothetical protein